VRQIGLKAVFGAQPARERLEQAHRDLDLIAALPADEMAMPVRVGEVPPRDPVFEMRVRHVAKSLERLEVSVHRRWIDLRMLFADSRGDLLRCGVMPRALKGREDQAPLDRHTHATGVDPLLDLHYRNCLATTCTLQ
jgi:hypothetical protein